MSFISSRSVLCRHTSTMCAAVLHLPARDLGGLFSTSPPRTRILEQPGADHVGALADDQRPVGSRPLRPAPTEKEHAMRAGLDGPGLLSLNHFGDRF